MKHDIIFAGVGGQGIVSAAAMLVEQADRLGFVCKQNEVHGMAQRGGAVVCFVRLSTETIYSDIIPKGAADFILATEPMEALRYIEYLSPTGAIVTSNKPYKNIDYPDTARVFEAIRGAGRAVLVDVEALIAELKNERVVNIAMMGALSKALKLDGLKEGMLKDIEKRFAKKGEAMVSLNKRAFAFGEAAVS